MVHGSPLRSVFPGLVRGNHSSIIPDESNEQRVATISGTNCNNEPCPFHTHFVIPAQAGTQASFINRNICR